MNLSSSVAAAVLALCVLAGVSSASNCNPNGQRVDCGYVGIDQDQCEAKGCCWSPVNPNPSNLPWCFYQNYSPAPTPQYPSPPPGTPPFSQSEIDKMMGYFVANIDIQGSGAVVAAPDYNTPGGSYYYHWMRDAAISMRALMITNDNTTFVDSKMQSYVQWVLKVQSKPDNNVDVRVEPKFTIPDGNPYSGGWCRPQTDGPGLRAGTLSLYALYLLNNNSTGSSYVREYLYTGSDSILHGGAIKYDLDWVAQNWQNSGCDLWEEITSNDFFWNRINFRYGLNVGAMVADEMGDSSTASKWRSIATQIEGTLYSHYNGQYIFESINREKDAAVIAGINMGYMDDNFFAPNSNPVAQTIEVYDAVFNSMFPINFYDTNAGLGGIMYGRYEGDTYAGGNPWILTTAELAQVYYNGAVTTLRTNSLPSAAALRTWSRLIPSLASTDSASLTPRVFARAVVQQGDDILFRIRAHVVSYDFHLSEQLDKNTGAEVSAGDLTWSYASLLKAMYYRTNAIKGLI